MVSQKREEIREEVRNYILEEFLQGEDPASLDDTTALVSSGILDSISTAKLVSHLEDRFGVRFKAHEIGAQKMDSVGQIVSLVDEKIQA